MLPPPGLLFRKEAVPGTAFGSCPADANAAADRLEKLFPLLCLIRFLLLINSDSLKIFQSHISKHPDCQNPSVLFHTHTDAAPAGKKSHIFPLSRSTIFSPETVDICADAHYTAIVPQRQEMCAAAACCQKGHLVPLLRFSVRVKIPLQMDPPSLPDRKA